LCETPSKTDSSLVSTPPGIDELIIGKSGVTIRGIVQGCGEMTKFEKKNGGSGVLFNARLADMSGVEVRLTFLNRACAAALKHVELEKVVEISGGRVMAPYQGELKEVVFEEGCRFREVEDASEWKLLFRPVSLSNLVSHVGAVVDVKGVLLSAGELCDRQGKSMRELVVADESGCCVKVAVWGRWTDRAEFRSSGAQRFAIELCGCVVKAFADELSLSMIKEGWLKLTSASESWQQCGVGGLEPHGPVSVELGSSTFQALSETLARMSGGMRKHGSFVVSVVGKLLRFGNRDGVAYQACRGNLVTGRPCQRKSCTDHVGAPVEPRYRVRVMIADGANERDQVWVDIWGSIAETLFKVPAAEAVTWSHEAAEDHMDDAVGTVFIWDLRVKYQEEQMCWRFSVMGLRVAAEEQAVSLKDLAMVAGDSKYEERAQKKRQAEEERAIACKEARTAASEKRVKEMQLKQKIESLAADFCLQGQAAKAEEAFAFLEGGRLPRRRRFCRDNVLVDA